MNKQLSNSGGITMSLTTPDLLECADAEYFVRLCREELKRYPRSPVIVTSQTAKDIDMSGIMKMTPEQIDEALRLMEHSN